MSIQAAETTQQAGRPTPKKRPGVGVALFVFDDAGRFPLLCRAGSHGAGCWGLIGGHLENGDTPQSAAVDEAEQETGLILDPAEIALGPYTNDIFLDEPNKHYVTLFASTRLPPGQSVENREPHKCTAIEWVTFDRMPETLFLPVRNFLLQAVRPPFRL